MTPDKPLVPPWRLREDELFARAECRVDRSPRLRKYKATILADWRDGADHLRWVVKARVSDIESWAKEIAENHAPA